MLLILLRFYKNIYDYLIFKQLEIQFGTYFFCIFNKLPHFFDTNTIFFNYFFENTPIFYHFVC